MSLPLPLTPRHSLMLYLRQGGGQVPLVTWGDEASPFYWAVQTPIPAFPYVVVKRMVGTPEHTFEGGYVERYKTEIRVYANQTNIDRVTGPTVEGSVFWYLDQLATNSTLLNGAGFEVEHFLREDYEVQGEEQRDGDSVKTVWFGVANYEMMCNQKYPTPRN